MNIKKEKKHIVVLSGAGMSAESGLKTFRDANGLWEGHDVMTVASPQGWSADQALVLDFYNQRRRQLLDVQPNKGHLALAQLEKDFEITIVTQNVDDLHERAGSSHVIHLHGELLKVRSTLYPHLVYDWYKDLHLGDRCAEGAQLRPDIVWFGEAVPLIETAADIVGKADILFIIGTSLQVYPAAGLIQFAAKLVPTYYIDPAPQLSPELRLRSNLSIIEEVATNGVPQVINMITS